MRTTMLFLLTLFFVSSCTKEELILPNSPKALSPVGLESGILPGNTLHVPGDYATIGAALAAASDNDKILVAAGTYNEGQLDITGFKNLRLVATGNAILLGRLRIENSSDIVIRGFTIQSTLTDADETLIDLPGNNGDDIRIVDNTLLFPFATDHHKYGIRVLCENAQIRGNRVLVTNASLLHVGIDLVGSFLFVKGNEVEFMNLYPGALQNYGIKISLGIEYTVVRNSIIGAERGIMVSAVDVLLLDGNSCLNNTDYGIYCSNSCETTMEGNTVLGNGICDIYIEGDCETILIDNIADCIEGD